MSAEFDAIVRAYGDEPVRVTAVRTPTGGFEIYRTDRHRRLGWPPNLIYQFDSLAFDGLRAAYDSGDNARLLALWRSLSQKSRRAPCERQVRACEQEAR